MRNQDQITNKNQLLIDKTLRFFRLAERLESYPPRKKAQYQVAYIFAVSGILLSATYAVIYAYLGLIVVAQVMLGSVFVTFILLYVVRTRITSDTLVHLVLGLLFVILIVANFYLGGFDNPNDVWFMVAPVIAGLLIKRQPIWFYSLLSLTIVMGFFIAKQLGFNFSATISEGAADAISLANRLGAVMALSLLIILYRYEWFIAEMELKKNQQNLFELANFDPLTKLVNRSYFADEYSAAIKQADKEQTDLTMLFIDLDSFKIINDTYGHNVGDELLEQVSERLKNELKQSGLLSRHGGDEFLVMMNLKASTDEIEQFCHRVIFSLSQPFQLKNHSATIGCSIGVATYPQHGRNFIEVLRAADIAMYGAKAKGGEQFKVFSDKLSRKVEDSNKLAIELRNAIESDQLHLNYQPKVALQNQSIVGYEALLRWTNKSGKKVAPDVFIKVAEEYSLINKLGDWTLRNVCQQLQMWQQETGERVSVAINVSALQLFKQDFIESLTVITEHYQVLPEQLELELTESVFVDSSFKILHKLQKLKDLGFKLIIDDYGTGYASIGYLKKFPISGLKIDKSFIKDLSFRKEDLLIVESTISLAHQLGLEITAEGIESLQQVQLLEALNCDVVQGYYFGRPMAASEVDFTQRQELKQKLDSTLAEAE